VAPMPSSKRFRQGKIPHLGQDNNLSFGDKHRTMTPGYSRVYFINPSRVSHHRDLLDFCEILHSLRAIDTDIFGLPESNLDTLKPAIRARLERICSDFFGTSLLASSTSSLSSHTLYKPGGTLTGADGIGLTGGPERKSESEVSTFQGRTTRFGSSFLAFRSTNVDFDI
jgi:hypothetical protein